MDPNRRNYRAPKRCALSLARVPRRAALRRAPRRSRVVQWCPPAGRSAAGSASRRHVPADHRGRSSLAAWRRAGPRRISRRCGREIPAPLGSCARYRCGSVPPGSHPEQTPAGPVPAPRRSLFRRKTAARFCRIAPRPRAGCGWIRFRVRAGAAITPRRLCGSVGWCGLSFSRLCSCV